MEFYDKHQADRDRFVILTFHDTRAENFEELDPRLEQLERDVWKGRKFPFPILLDATGQTLASWGVRGFPTLVLIDPKGALVQMQAGVPPSGGVEELLAEKLKAEKKTKVGG
jgi:thioredoxin-like negative regulator of GroEL